MVWRGERALTPPPSPPLPPPPDYGQAEDQGVFCRWGVIKEKARFWKQKHKG